jgi:hypothetical protein
LFTYGQNTLVQHRLCRSGDYDKISLIHLDLVKFPLGISKPLNKQQQRKNEAIFGCNSYLAFTNTGCMILVMAT